MTMFTFTVQSATEYLIWMTTAWSAVSEYMENNLKEHEEDMPGGFKVAEGNLSFKGVCGECRKRAQGE